MKFYLRLLFLLCLSIQVKAQNPSLIAVQYSSGLVKPVCITNCNDSRLFVVEQDGRIRIINNGTLVTTPFLDINPVVGSSGNEQGLLGVAFHPNYKSNGYFYVNYTNNSGNTVIARYSVNPADSNLALTNSELVLLTIAQPYSNHNGGDLAFGPDGYLYIGTGDGGSANDPGNRGQDITQYLGKMLRIDVDHGTLYAIPPDNPFVNVPTAVEEIWNLGMRNPWRFDFDNLTGDLWIGDVGQNIWEEVDFQAAGTGSGKNYGWRCYEGNAAFNTAGCAAQSNYEAPAYVYQHTGGNCSISGGAIYRGGKYANMFGYYVFTDFCVSSLRTLKRDTTSFSYLQHATLSGISLSCFGEDNQGEIYTGSLYTGAIYHIVDTSSCAPVAYLSDLDTLHICDTITTLYTPPNDSNMYTWKFNGNIFGGAISNTLVANQSGQYIVIVTSLSTFCSSTDTVIVDLKTPAPAASISGIDSLYCIFQSPVNLILDPPGGSISGVGVTGTSFDPSLAGAGSYTLNYVYEAPNGCTSSAAQQVSVYDCSGLNSVDRSLLLKVYPNPSSSIFNIDLEIKSADIITISLSDLTGRVVSEKQYQLNSGVQKIGFDISSVMNGNYVMKISGNQRSAVVPVTVIR